MADDNKDTKKPADAEEEEEEDEEDLEKLQAEIARMEAEAAKISKETEALAAPSTTDANKPARDGCSIYVGQVDYSATPEDLLKHFEACGTVERVTIVCDKYTGRPKGTFVFSRRDNSLPFSTNQTLYSIWGAGFAYLEFQVGSSMLALLMPLDDLAVPLVLNSLFSS